MMLAATLHEAPDLVDQLMGGDKGALRNPERRASKLRQLSNWSGETSGVNDCAVLFVHH